MSTSMCQTPLSTPTWDVFLSFRGIDTGYNFVSHLYAALDRHGIKTFKDDSEQSSGVVISDAVLRAIHDSKKSIIVFSENFASSFWCLNELLEMMKCCKTAGRSVTPVFYKIDPSVVQHQIGGYKEAFEKHLLSFEMEKVNKWRLALSEVAGLPGYHVSQNRYEIDIINEIVDEILLDITPKTLDVAKYPVGLDSRVRDITALLKIYSVVGIHGMGGLGKTTLAEKIYYMGGVGKTTLAKKIGIYGMGGVGKTTLAKAVYNQNYKHFQGSCFLENVREVSRKKGLECLQQQLINDVLKRQNINIYNVDQGIELIRARIVSTKVLIVIDDIDDPRHLEYLEGPFALGSIMIITTRNEDLLDSIKVEARYKVNELSNAESRQLFSLHAFGDNKISEAFTESSTKMLQRAGGLPLALKVLGSNLLNQSEEGDQCTDKLNDVKKKLKISFDALELVDPMLQDIFLDVACSFVGREKEEVVTIMNTYYSFVDQKIDFLQKRCLLTINNGKGLSMNSLLMDIGREVARNNSPDDDPGKHSRLWLSKDIYDVIKNHKGTEAIEVIIPHNFYHQDSHEGVSFSTETFKRMSKLRFLHLDRVNLTGNFGQTLEDLRWFCWDWCPLKFLPSEFYLQKLVILELPHSRLRTLWELNMISQVFEKLKTLNMWKSLDLTSTTDFAKLPCLETLILEGCESLKEVDASIGSLARLVSLNLGGCVNLRNLPDSICNLVALERLNIDNCSSLIELPMELGNIEFLKELNAEGLTVSKLPDSIGWLSKLVDLRLSCNDYLKTLPDSFYNLRSLEVLDISYCKNLEILPYQLPKLIRLRELYARGASLLKKNPHKKSNMTALSLKKLYLSESVITSLPSGISQLRNLEVLNLRECRNLLYIAELPPNLKELRAKGCTSMLRLPNLSNLKQLEILDLTGCSGLAEIQGLEELTSLRELPLGGCNSSLMAYTFTQRFFQIYSGFGHEIKIYAQSAEFPDWISRSSNLGSSVSLDLQPNVSRNFLGMILCFKYCEDEGFYRLDYSVKTTRSEFTCSYDGLYSHFYNESWMVIVPRSIFSLTDGDDRIEIAANQEILGIHLLHKTEITMIEHVSTPGKVEEEISYPSKRLKHLESDN